MITRELRERRNSGILNPVRSRIFLLIMLVVPALPLAVARNSQQPATPQKPPAAPSPAVPSLPPAGATQAAKPPLPSTSPAAPAGQQPAPSAAQAPITTVVLDPAHGGPDSGARGPSGVAESQVVLDFARAVRVSLEAQGFRVLLTREGDQNPSFDERSSLVNGLRGAVFISLHVASNGTVGTARAYSYAFPPADVTGAAPAPASAAPPPVKPDPRPVARVGLIEWDRAQQSFTDASQRLAELVEIQLAQKLRGSPDMPLAVPVRQLRTIAAPAIAIEVSSVAVPDAKRLTQLNQPLADAVARAVVDFRAAVASGAAASAPLGGGAR